MALTILILFYSTVSAAQISALMKEGPASQLQHLTLQGREESLESTLQGLALYVLLVISHSYSGWTPLSHLSAEFKTLLPGLATEEKTKIEKKEKTSRLNQDNLPVVLSLGEIVDPVFLRLCEIPMILYLSSVKYLALLKDEVHYFNDSLSLTVWAISDC
ncbi:LOW QUALITY PROTEIN: hypothetical protein OSB04_028808 [Centaurea solstitialis]|uniref:Uncharacterized protein n=1 Tax=Centaurea solstitialis TaxID=347529 RepID=A0AA38VY56_9ASTR|nr:LOW QUALITY PROTEIN: hypothetical protein OSB04_028808 [Centaurea solstitialis]